MVKKIILAFLAIALIMVASPRLLTATAVENNYMQANTVAAGNDFFMALKADGSLWTQGYNWMGQLGTGTTVDEIFAPVKVMDNVVSVATGNLRGLAVKNDGSLWSWGDNQYGQIGDGTVTTYHYDNNNYWVAKENNDKTKPVKIMDNVVSVAAGTSHSLALKNDGSLWAWGDNQHGQIGDGTVTTYNNNDEYWLIKENHDKTKPVKIMNDVRFIAAGAYISLAIKVDGSLWVWGAGTIGDGIEPRWEPTPTKVMDDVAFAAAGPGNVLAIKTDGSLWAWGENYSGQLGNGTITTVDKNGVVVDNNNKLSPTKILDKVAFASVGAYHSLAIKTDGSLWAWGDNTFGQLGNGKITVRDDDNWDVIIRDNNAARPIKLMDNVACASAGYYYNLIVKKDGSLWGWGNTGALNNKSMGMPEKIMTGIKLPASAIIPPAAIPGPDTPPATITSFSDVPTSHWAYSSIMLLVEKGVISGYADGLFKPNELVSRSEFAKMMTLALQIPLIKDTAPSFADVSRNDWEFVYVETAKKYLTGYQQGESYYFKGKEPAVREDMAVALVKTLNLESEVADDINAEYVYARLQQIFSDADTISPNLRKYVLLAYEADLIGGYTDGTCGPQKSITRAEAASMLVKVLKSAAMQKVTFN